MTKEEWLNIGYDKHIIEDFAVDECMTFYDVYKRWFLMKIHKNRGSTVDRIEVTYNKYISDKDIEYKYIHTFTEDYICKYFNDLITNLFINYKEFQRIYQIINNVVNYGHDLSIGHAPLIDWGKVKRYVNNVNMNDSCKCDKFVNMSDRQILFDSVLHDNVLPTKKNTCLLILLNFYLGLRLGELSALRFDDFDISNKVVYVKRTEKRYYTRDEFGCKTILHYDVSNELKTNNSCRIVPLVDKAIYLYNMIVNNHIDNGYNSPYLCYDGYEVCYSYAITRTLKHLCSICGIKPFNTHLIRKTFASELHANGVPTRLISDMLGHSTIGITERYYIVGTDNYTQYYTMLNNACCNMSSF